MAYETYAGVNEISRTDELKLDKAVNSFMIGRLRLQYPLKPTKVGTLQIFINPLCSEPLPVIELSVFDNDYDYIGFDYKQNKSMLPATYDTDSYDVDERMDELEDWFTDKLIIFHPEYSHNIKNGQWFRNFYITGLLKDNIDLYNSFEMVPRVQMSVNAFEKVLRKGEFFDLPGYDAELSESPQIILCGSYAYRLKESDSTEDLLTPNPNNPERWKCTNSENIVKVDLSKIETYKTCSIRASDSIYFLESNLHNEALLKTEFEPFEEDRVKEEIEAVMAEKAKAAAAAAVAVNDDVEVDEEEDDFNSDEILFLEGLRQQTLDNGLQYKFDDLVNFHTSIKTNPLTILAGMSGTGKSRLAMNYAKMLNLSEDNDTLLFLPISPSYTEPSDVLGYLNSMNGLYVPSETGLVKFLRRANERPDQMHMVIFDEMNLSQIEYWFSPFLSILEKDMNDRTLRLYDEDAHCINKAVYPSTMKIGENIIFVGTVNIDDTTKDFSNRLLDRTFVINLDMVNFSQFYRDYQKRLSGNERVDVPQTKCKNVAQFIGWCHNSEKNYIDAFKDNLDELTFFDELNDLIRKYIPDGGISHRVLKNIGNYIQNVPLKNGNMIIDRKQVFDTVINQTVMTKIRGTETQLQGLIGTSEGGIVVDSELATLLDKYSELSDFSQIRKNLFRKSEELRINGYTN